MNDENMRASVMLLRFALLAIVSVLAATSAHSQSLTREELRIPMAAAGSDGLEALLVRPAGSGRHPLMLINHGSPRNASARPDMEAQALAPIADEFARRGFAALVVMRRGYGSSGGGWAESFGQCDDPDYTKAGRAAAADLTAAINHMARQSHVDASRIMSVGVSAGGFATVALTASAPQGFVAAINFAGGRGSLSADEVCEEDELVAAMRAFGKTSRVPMLWVYAQNDRFFGPALARKMRDAFTEGGGKAEFVAAPAHGPDGHTLFSANSIPAWTPYVDRFLAKVSAAPVAPAATPRDSAPAAASRTMSPPSSLSANGKKAFEAYLAAKNHKAFAVASDGSFGWRSGRSTLEEAKQGAMTNCEENGDDCEIVSTNGSSN